MHNPSRRIYTRGVGVHAETVYTQRQVCCTTVRTGSCGEGRMTRDESVNEEKYSRPHSENLNGNALIPNARDELVYLYRHVQQA